MAAKEEGTWEYWNNTTPTEYVKSVKQLKSHFQVLEKFTAPEAPPKVIRCRTKVRKAFYGFGDALGKGFGFVIEIEDVVYTELGQWNSTIEDNHSNYKEFLNLVYVMEAVYAQGALKGCELYVFTDNFVAEAATYNGGFNQNKELGWLVFRLWKLEMKCDFSLFIYHVAGTCMIQTGIDSLLQGDKEEGISLGM